jgi:transposase
MHVTTIGIDLAKHVFQIHGVDADGGVVVRRKLRRSEVIDFLAKLPPASIGMEACVTAHHWARELGALGHCVRLIPPAYVKPFVKRQKNDAADAEAICEAVSRPSMRFVPIKNVEQQGVLVLHRTRDLLIRQRTMLANAFRAHLAEFGIVDKLGSGGLDNLIGQIEANALDGVPPIAHEGLMLLVGQIRDTQVRVTEIEKRIVAWHRASDVSRRLETIPGIGPIIASAIAATVTDASVFASGRQLSAWLGLVPRQHSSGGKERLRGITKQGDPYIRRLLIIRRDRRSAVHTPTGADRRLDIGASGAATAPGRGGCACQQDGAHRVGSVGARANLSSACDRGLIATAPSVSIEMVEVKMV